jgi:tryptophanyl-tRNA synthetase
MTQFKDKARKHESVDAGLLFYPVLMAADILLYNAELVPVGDDQKQHLELARDLAEKFNHRYSDTFKIPEPFISKVGSRIMSLQDPSAKMSKSDPNQSSTVYITDSADEIRKKIMSSVTDSGSEVKFAEDKPGVSNLLTILSACTGESISVLENKFIGKGYGDFKKAVADAVVATLNPVRTRYETLIKDRAELDKIFKMGAEQAQSRAFKVLSKVNRKVGFVERPR